MCILDAFYGSPRHGTNTYSSVMIASPSGDHHTFSADFNVHNRYELCNLHHDQTIKGYLHIKPSSEIIKLQPQIVTLIPPTQANINHALDAGETRIHGQAVLEFTENFNDSPIDVTYHLQHTKTMHIIHRVEFTISTAKLTETYKILHYLGTPSIESI